jgi:hypothetical protein
MLHIEYNQSRKALRTRQTLRSRTLGRVSQRVSRQVSPYPTQALQQRATARAVAECFGPRTREYPTGEYLSPDERIV